MLAFASWLDAANDVGTPVDGLFGVGCGLTAGETLEDDSRIPANFQVLDGVFVRGSRSGGGEAGPQNRPPNERYAPRGGTRRHG